MRKLRAGRRMIARSLFSQPRLNSRRVVRDPVRYATALPTVPTQVR